MVLFLNEAVLNLSTLAAVIDLLIESIGGWIFWYSFWILFSLLECWLTLSLDLGLSSTENLSISFSSLISSSGLGGLLSSLLIRSSFQFLSPFSISWVISLCFVNSLVICLIILF